jgi:eukaryotic-like serine/threonine-protein kinase
MLENSDNRQDTIELIQQFQAGDENSAAVLFERYLARLTALARVRLSQKLAQRVDADDVVMSAWRSFFVGARNAQFSILDAGDLWSLLVKITLRKLYRQADRHTAAIRSVDREVGGLDVDIPLAELTDGPTPEAIVEASDLLEAVMKQLPDSHRSALELRLQGSSFDEIAEELGSHERTVRRWFEHIRELFESTTSAPDQEPTPEIDAPIPRQATTAIPIDIHPNVSYPDKDLLKYSDYILKKHIGSGRTGKVFQAVHVSTGRTVAVKFLRKSFQTDENSVAGFVAEAQTLKMLKHPHIVAIDGLGHTLAGGWFIVMELVDGGDLSVLRRPPSIDSVVNWLRQAALGVLAAHDQDVIHCDMKPANLLLGSDQQVRVCDFGLARQSTQARSPSIAGTPAFMAPEQVAECWGIVSHETDVYGLGATLYALLTGQAPFDDQQPLNVLAKIVSRKNPPSPKTLRPDCPDELCELCMECLNKNPADRPSIRQLIERLESSN